MLEHIYVVLGGGISDIGKGWLTGSIASVLPNALPVKIDPMLTQQFPVQLGITVEGKVISEDFLTYQALGLPIYPECNIIGGALLHEFLHQPQKTLSQGFDDGAEKKLTFADLSDFLAAKLLALTNLSEDCRSLVIEVGGTITDMEHVYIGSAIRALGLKVGILPKVVLLSFLEHPETDTGSPARTHNVRQIIQEARSRYSVPIKACFVRRRYVPEWVKDEEIEDELLNIAYETQMSPSQLVYVPNLDSVQDLKDLVKMTGLFEEKGNLLVSACLFGIRCRYDATSDALDPEMVNLLRGREAIIICPELLAGLSVPREPVEIVNGDGFDVLDGNAKVLTRDGSDFTQQFIEGAKKALEIAKRSEITKAILCSRSPSCGCLNIYDGSFEHRLRPGCGVFGALLKRNNIHCVPNTMMRERKTDIL